MTTFFQNLELIDLINERLGTKIDKHEDMQFIVDWVRSNMTSEDVFGASDSPAEF